MLYKMACRKYFNMCSYFSSGEAASQDWQGAPKIL